jgi:hypothetical protein
MVLEAAATRQDDRPQPDGRRWLPSSFPCLHLLLISVAAVAFYVYARAFPLFGGDGAFNYMSLVERLDSTDAFSLLFGYKLVEGLGQPNPFLTIIFDPFSWPLLALKLLRHSPRGVVLVFQLTMALRVIACWLGTYLFGAWAFPGTRTVALTAGYLNTLLTFFLSMNIGSTELYGAMYNGTQAAFLPLAAGVYLRGVVLQKPFLSWNSLIVVALIFFLLMSYPIGSLVTAAVLVAIMAAAAAGCRTGLRWRAVIQFAGFTIATGILLFLPGIDAYSAWQSIASISARFVFADELKPYFVTSSPPTFWFTPPLAARLIVLCAVAAAFVVDRVPPLARATITVLALIVLGIQTLYLVSSWSIFGEIVRPLPPLTRIERQLTLLYSFAAAVALYRAERLLQAPNRRSLVLWIAAAVAVAVTALYTLDIVYDGPLSDWGLRRSTASKTLLALTAMLLMSALVWNMLRLFLPGTLPSSLRETPLPFCGDIPRARYVRLAVPYVFVALITALAIRIWITRPYFIAADATRYLLCDHVTLLGCSDSDFGRSVYAGNNPVVEFLREHLAATAPFSGRAEYLSPYTFQVPSSANLVDEENRNFLASGSGFMLSALPFHGIPVASTYEQSHDYLYYLFWTRYLTQNSRVRFSPNWTGLFQLLPDSLALAGVRYVVTRRANMGALGSAPVVFAWKDYVVAELAAANTHGYGAIRIRDASTLAEALSLMRDADFVPRTDAVLLPADRKALPDRSLEPVAESTIETRQQQIHLTARSAGAASLIILPFRFSHCWRVEWNGPVGVMLRADVALIAIYFEQAVDANFTWLGGYGRHTHCLAEDASLIEEARTAAKEIPY